MRSSISHTIKTIILSLSFIFLISAQSEIVQDKTNTNDSAYVPSKSPWTAVLLSAVIPGAGQIYNESYFKAPIVWGISGWFVYNWIQNNSNYKDNSDLYLQTGDEDYRRLRNFYRDQRDMFSIYLGLTYVLNLVDAYVDADLFDFTVEEDFLIHQPRMGIRFKLR
ncbi:MAG: hypothetical protein HXY50_15065 [Ignavibacteriaceae bacterium]|nr:hypothetical protein [Ignavibacteriaceae bacterium]